MQVGAGNLGCANGFPPIAIQNDLTPEFQHYKREQVIRMVAALRGMIGYQSLNRWPVENSAAPNLILGKQLRNHRLEVLAKPGANRRPKSALFSFQNFARQPGRYHLFHQVLHSEATNFQ